MDLLEAYDFLSDGIKRPGWVGFIRADANGKIWFYKPMGRAFEKTRWRPFVQDIRATDWEVANRE